MRRYPLYDPVGERASYNTVLGKLPGWHQLGRRLVDEVQPVLIIIDPALTAFVGDANSPTQVMTFLDALSSEAGKRRAGVLLLAHSTKSSRATTADPFHPGMVSGTGAWTDHVRGVLTMGEYQHKTPKSGKAERGSEDDSGETMLVLRVYKANWGPSRITLRLQTQMPKGNATPVAFVADGPWGPGPAPGALPRSKTNGGKAAEETMGPMEDEFDDFG